MSERVAYERCELCSGYAVKGSTCPKSVDCPRCGALPGKSCRRPSGHRADVLHAERYQDAEARDARRGIVYPEAGVRA